MLLNRRNAITRGLLGAAGAGLLPRLGASAQEAPHAQAPEGLTIAKGPFQGTRRSLHEYQVPAWFRDAKFGMWAHWGPQSAIEAGDWYARNMYMEGSKQYNYHVQHYGHPSQFGYKDTIPAWKAEKFDPEHLMSLYKKAGARYFMSMGVHHDNFDMWNSKHNPWNAASMGPKRDVVGEWSKAARAAGLKFGVSEHLWITYKWFSVSHGSDLKGPKAGVKYDGADPKNRSLYVDSDQVWSQLDWNEDGIPDWWKRHWYLRMRDVLDQYKPDFLYSDGPLPFQDYGLSIVAHLYNMHATQSGTDGVYFSKREADSAVGTCVLDRERGVLEDILPRSWQTDTCIGDWHYLRGATYKNAKTVVDLLVDIVSKNGNLMMNFPLPASGMLDAEELAVLDEMSTWIAVNGEGIYGTRPWKVYGESSTPVTAVKDTVMSFNEKGRRDLNATDVRFTTKGSELFAFAMGWPDYALEIKSLGQNSPLRPGKIETVEVVGASEKVEWKQEADSLKVMPPARMTAPTKHASLFRIKGALTT